MKNHMGFKFLAVVLGALALLTAVATATGVVSFMKLGLYTNSLEELQDQQMLDDLEVLSEEIAVRYAASNLSNCPKALINAYLDEKFDTKPPRGDQWFYIIKDENGQVLASRYSAQQGSGTLEYEFLITPEYPRVVGYTEVLPGVTPSPLLPDPGTAPEGTDPDAEAFEFEFYDEDTRKTHRYGLVMNQGPVYLVQLYLRPGAYEQEVAFTWELMALGHEHRYDLFVPLVLGLLVLGLCLTYLASAAGKKPGREKLFPGGLNRLPLDLYLVTVGGACWFLAESYISVVGDRFARDTAQIITISILLTAYLACLGIVGFYFACAAQFQLRGGYWWRHSALWNLFKLLRRALRSLVRLGKVCAASLKKSWRKFLELIPLTWQWILWGAVMCTVLVLAVLSRNLWAIGGALVFVTASLFYVLHIYKLLLDGVKRMSQGDLETQVDTSQLMGGFVEFGAYLNALADVAVVAAQKQMQSERMRAELITNVSHDIKTPLTSIINYADLLKQAPDKAAAEEYLEVLSRQSLRMKKLIDDLIELSKATTGNLPVHMEVGDGAEYLNQALGEFADKLEAVPLTPVFEAPAEPVLIRCDGRLTWRVLSNLLSNAVKYALPGTRLYADMEVRATQVVISLKNISKDPLNVSSQELMERFVRGDRSRNTEGSGLGLNIAKSLMELQHGSLDLLVDGDLFKATLVFQRAENS